jgi:tripartite-type tricarboxylate transporter receptor subunit TctC
VSNRLAALFASCLATACLLPVAGRAATADPAAGFPGKSIRFLVPFAPGGGNDLVARLIASRLTETWGQQIIVDNRAGGGGVVGTEMTAKATPDGHTLMLAHTGTMAINPNLYRNVSYDPVRDFTPVVLVASSALVLVVHPSVQARSVKDLIASGRANPGQLNFASGGVGTGSHLSGEMFRSMAGLDMTHVSYKGTGPAVIDLIGGQVKLMFSVMPSAIPHIASKRLVALAVTGGTRSRMMETVPTVAESGLPGYESVLRYGIVGPRGIPAGIRDKLSREIRRIAALEDFQSALLKTGAEPLDGGPDQYGRLIAQELTFWSKVVKASGARAD